MDVLEVLVLMIALVLIALVVAVVLVAAQAMAAGKNDEEEDTSGSHSNSEPSGHVDAPLVQPAEAIPDIAAEPIAPSVAVEAEKVQETAIAQEPVMQSPEPRAPEPRVNERQPTDTIVTNPGSDRNGPTHRAREERDVDSDHQSRKSAGRTHLAEDEVRRPAVDTNDTAVSQSDENFPYMGGGPLLSPIERLFYGDLKTSVSDKTEVFTKVRASDVISPKSELSFEEAQFAAEQLATQRFDFVLCDSQDFSVLCVIELDGLSEREGLRKIQREILRKAAESANVPVLLVDMKRGYTIKEIRDRVSYLLPRETEAFVTESHISHSHQGQHGKRRISDLITEVDEPEEDMFADVANVFEEAENNSIHAYGNVRQQHQMNHRAEHSHRPASTAPPKTEFRQESAFSARRDNSGAPVEPTHSTPHGTGESASVDEHTGTRCPRCASPLKMSMATTGEFAGRYFWICTKLPECPYVAPITPPE